MNTEKPRVAIATTLPDDARARIEEVATCVDVTADAEGAWLDALADVEGILCGNFLTFGEAQFAKLPALRVLSGIGVGYDRFDITAASGHGVAVCNTPGVLTAAVADLTLGFIIAAARSIPASDRYVHEGGWRAGNPLPPLGSDLAGKKLGIVGYGRIGRAVWRRAQAFDMEACFFDLFDDEGAGEAGCEYRALDDLLRESDYVSLHVDLNEQTHHLISTRELALMKPTAWLVNTSRGPVVDQQALTEALRAGQIGGAALDVLEQEPPAADDPILSLPNTIIQPHAGSATVETRRAMLDLAVSNLIAVVGGTPPPACVNPSVLPGNA